MTPHTPPPKILCFLLNKNNPAPSHWSHMLTIRPPPPTAFYITDLISWECCCWSRSFEENVLFSAKQNKRRVESQPCVLTCPPAFYKRLKTWQPKSHLKKAPLNHHRPMKCNQQLITKILACSTPNNTGPSYSPHWHNTIVCIITVLCLSLHNLCILFLYWHQCPNVCSGDILIPSTRLHRTMPYMECWTQLLIMKAENVLKSAARFTDEPQICRKPEWEWCQTGTDWQLWELDTLCDTWGSFS